MPAWRLNRFTPSAQPLGGASSLELLYRQHYGWLLRVVRRRFGGDQAEDLVQETFTRASSYAGREIRNPRALLLQIATRAAIDRDRRRATRPPLYDVTDETASNCEHQAEALALKQLILALPEPLRQVFLLSRFGGLTYEDIAVHCGISVKTVEWRMTKALKLCAKALGR